MKLLVDFGNSRLKWATYANGRFVPGGVFAHADLDLVETLRANWSALPRPAALLVASVAAPAREAELAGFARERFDHAAEFLTSPRRALGIDTVYAKPETLGIDRFLSLAALHAQRAQAQVLASIGTALTLDALDAHGHHVGGLIAPSPTLARHAIATGTARVGEAEGHLATFADNTADAVHSGALLGAVALVREFHAQAALRFGRETALTLTGGGAAELLAHLPTAESRPNLVLRGLALWAEARD
jgi:type III pantothenate kinase